MTVTVVVNTGEHPAVVSRSRKTEGEVGHHIEQTDETVPAYSGKTFDITSADTLTVDEVMPQEDEHGEEE